MKPDEDITSIELPHNGTQMTLAMFVEVVTPHYQDITAENGVPQLPQT